MHVPQYTWKECQRQAQAQALLSAPGQALLHQPRPLALEQRIASHIRLRGQALLLIRLS